MIGATELLVIAAVVLLLFGGKKLPELMRGMGQGVRTFKEGMNEVTKPIEPKPEEPQPKEEPQQKDEPQ